MKAEPVYERILVSLDALLDTRLGVIAQKYPHLVSKFFHQRYYGRIQDKFKEVPDFDTLYKNRDKETLQNSLMTNITLLMGYFVRTSANEVLKGGQPNVLSFQINIHPYEMDAEEKQDLIGALEFHVGDAAEISVVSIPNEFLTPEACKEQYAVLVMYDFANWLTMHSEKFKQVRMPNMVVYAPKLLQKLPTKAEQKEMGEMNADPFEVAVIAASPAFSLRFLTVDTFSVRNPEKDVKRAQMKFSQNVDLPEEDEKPTEA